MLKACNFRLFSLLIFLAYFVQSQIYGEGTTLSSNNLTVNLFKIQDNLNLQIIFEFVPKQNRHLYWWNSGDSGQPIKFAFTFDRKPRTVYPILLSPPELKKSEIIMNYILKERFLAVTSFDFDKVPTKFHAVLDYLVCEETCVPEEMRFDAVIEKLPKFYDSRELLSLDFPPLPNFIAIEEQASSVSFRTTKGTLFFFPIGAEPKVVVPGYDHVTVELPSNQLKGLLSLNDGHKTQYFKVGNWNFYPILTEEKSFFTQFFFQLILAFLSGLVLNFMPCVVPTLALKAAKLNIEQSALANLGYIVGSTLTVVILGIVVSGAFWGAETLGWGFQLQNKFFVFSITFLLWLTTLQFLGLIHLPIFLYINPEKAYPSSKGDFAFNFVLGVAITLIALPCGAPFLVTLLADAGSRGLLWNIALFFLLGLSFSGFYVLLSKISFLKTAIASIKSNYDTFLKILAIPLVCTFIWFLWILENQGLSISLVLTAYFSATIAITTLVTKRFIWLVLFGLITAYSLTSLFNSKSGSSLVGNGVMWEPFSETLIQKLQSEGSPYYLDFTAEWCVTCKVNKFLVFSDQDLVDQLVSKNFRFIKADWTNGDPKITEALRRRGANAVPLTIIFTAETGEITLPVLLTPAIIRQKLKMQ
ncbi:MAG: thioredoxin family protein [Deltaproteobacteria bacterium]|nr:thioredoxin family protein [Deltaproteobacteria bacterium]